MPSDPAYIDHSLCERLRRFLRQVVTYTAGDKPMLIAAREHLRVGAGVRMRRAVGVAFEGDRRDADRWSPCKPLLQFIVFRFPLSQPQPPSIVVDHHVDMVRIDEGCGAALESSIV